MMRIAVVALAVACAPELPEVGDPANRCDGFDYPVGAPDASGYFITQQFGARHHLGEDWTRLAGGNSGFGDPVYAIANGVIVEAEDVGGDWGNVVRIAHPCGVESLYAHLETIEVVRGARPRRGQRIGTIGTANGRYRDRAHLHFEIRDRPLPVGPGYSANRTGYLDPSEYIRTHRLR